jgi:hypothetical protein
MHWLSIALSIIEVLPTLIRLVGLAEKTVVEQDDLLPEHRSNEEKRKKVRRKLDDETLMKGIKASGPLKSAARELALVRKRKK